MDDREIVAAIAAGDPAGLADAYDKYAESLYGYSRWVLSDPEDAADAVQDTFVIAAARLGGLRDPRKLRPWLYAVARNECHRRLRAAEEAGLDEVAEVADPSADAGASAERAELRRLVRAALDGLNPGEREVIELGLRHDLQGADLAAVLGVPRNQAHALASRARGQLEKALGALLVARTGRRACPELDLLLDGWDGRLTVLTRKRVSRHIDRCDVCTDRRHGVLRPAALYGMAPLAALPRGLREEVLGLCADVSPQGQSYRRDVMQSVGPFLPNGFPQPARPPRSRMLALSGVAAAVGVLIAIAATGIITVLALTGSHTPHPAAAGRSGGPSGTASASVTASTGSAGGVSPSLSPATSAPAVINAAPPVAPPSASPTKAKPSPSATSSGPVTPTRPPKPPTPTPTVTGTPTPTSTSTSTATATPTPSFTFPVPR
jgi:RNA polymerase sigma factor (sigma-70 family)